MNCPFCQQKLRLLENHNERCDNSACYIHKMPRYVRIYDNDLCVQEHVVLTDTIYLHINHRANSTVISKLDIITISDHVKISHALKLDFSNIDKVVDKIKTLLIFS